MGFRVNGTDIHITRGDTGYFTFTPYVVDSSGERSIYQPQPGDSIRFAMKKKLSDRYAILLTKEVPTDTFTMKLEPEDTNQFKFGTYCYDVQLTTALGDVDTYIPATGETALFVIEKEVDVVD